MSNQDKVSGRLKQAAGDLMGNEQLREKGVNEERKADAKRELAEAQELADRKREEVARLQAETEHHDTTRQDTVDDPLQEPGHDDARRSDRGDQRPEDRAGP